MQLIQGEFNTNDAITIISEMVNVKITFHTAKINDQSTEEDIKYRESKIKSLQNELAELRKMLLSKNGSVKMNAFLTIEN